jgi:hypothetical protein
MGWGASFVEIRTPSDMALEIDGKPVAAVVTKGTVT